jgi:hypothetical protein
MISRGMIDTRCPKDVACIVSCIVSIAIACSHRKSVNTSINVSLYCPSPSLDLSCSSGIRTGKHGICQPTIQARRIRSWLANLQIIRTLDCGLTPTAIALLVDIAEPR